MRHAWIAFAAPVGATVIGLGTLGAMAVWGWPGERGVAGLGLCEAVGDGPLSQPANTLSNVGFFVVGWWIGWQAWCDLLAKKRLAWRNTLVTTIRYPASYAVSSVLIGLGSTALHASTTRWGAELDLLAMHLWGAWCIAFATTRLARVGDRWFAALFAAQLIALLMRISLGHPSGMKGSTLFGLMVAAAVAIETAGRYRNRRRQKMDDRCLIGAVGVFLVAYACWRASLTGGPWCDPFSWWQGHALWHLLSSCSTALTYLYARSERGR
ncbi:MAG: ceramidase domain-containing protein [Planctomycetota bacterium]